MTSSYDDPFHGRPRGWAALLVAEAFHETYERLAPEYGYETRPESAKPWAEVPENNKALMAGVCRSLIENRVIALIPPPGVDDGERAALVERLAEAMYVLDNGWLSTASMRTYPWREMDSGMVKDGFRERARRLVEFAGLASTPSAPESATRLDLDPAALSADEQETFRWHVALNAKPGATPGGPANVDTDALLKDLAAHGLLVVRAGETTVQVKRECQHCRHFVDVFLDIDALGVAEIRPARAEAAVLAAADHLIKVVAEGDGEALGGVAFEELAKAVALAQQPEGKRNDR